MRAWSRSGLRVGVELAEVVGASSMRDASMFAALWRREMGVMERRVVRDGRGREGKEMVKVEVSIGGGMVTVTVTVWFNILKRCRWKEAKVVDYWMSSKRQRKKIECRKKESCEVSSDFVP